MKSPSRRLLLAAALIATGLTVVAPANAAASCPSGWRKAHLSDGSGTGCQLSLSYSSALQSVVIPSGVTGAKIRIIATGAAGGRGGADGCCSIHGGESGAVGTVSAWLPVYAGEKLDLGVGGAGSPGANCATGAGGGGGGNNALPAYVGGPGANSGPYGCSGAGGGGGAATVVVAHEKNGDRTIVAAGGGGGGGASLGGPGGSGRAQVTGSGSSAGAAGQFRAGDNGGGGGGGAGALGGAGGIVRAADPEWVGEGGESGANSSGADLTSTFTSAAGDGSVTLEWSVPGLTGIDPAITVTQGPTPFIALATVKGVDVTKFGPASFTVVGKPGSAAPLVSATYSAATLAQRGYVDTGRSSVSIPVFGLYQSYANTIRLTYTLAGARKNATLSITTPAWSTGAAGQFASQSKVVQRDPSVKLDFGFIALKYFASANTPVVLDTDGEVRWIGPDFSASQPAIFHANAFYIAAGTSLARITLDGKVDVVADYAPEGVTGFHHNFDKGRDGILMQADRGSQVESTIIEAGTDGAVKHVWDLEQIVGDAMRAGGDDPSNFVRRGTDWLHTNATTYWKAQNQLVVSGREDFVMGIDYDTGALKWLLGDMSKAWAQYPSLRRYALKITGEPPIGQHAVSITAKGELMLFDNGAQSFNNAPGTPAGAARGYAVTRKYRINTRLMTATETWNFDHAKSVYSPICSSIYEFGSSLLINYASEGWGANIRLMALNSAGKTAFEYTVPGNWSLGWNASPMSWTNLRL